MKTRVLLICLLLVIFTHANGKRPTDRLPPGTSDDIRNFVDNCRLGLAWNGHIYSFIEQLPPNTVIPPTEMTKDERVISFGETPPALLEQIGDTILVYSKKMFGAGVGLGVKTKVANVHMACGSFIAWVLQPREHSGLYRIAYDGWNPILTLPDSIATSAKPIAVVPDNSYQEPNLSRTLDSLVNQTEVDMRNAQPSFEYVNARLFAVGGQGSDERIFTIHGITASTEGVLRAVFRLVRADDTWQAETMIPVSFAVGFTPVLIIAFENSDIRLLVHENNNIYLSYWKLGDPLILLKASRDFTC